MGRINRRISVTTVTVTHGRTTTDTRAGEVVAEEPLEIRADGEEVAQVFRTPGHDVELAHGLLLATGRITSAEDVATARYCEGAVGGANSYNLLDIALREPRRRFQEPASACGITAEQRVRELAAQLPVRSVAVPLDSELVLSIPGVLAERRARNLPVACVAETDLTRHDASPTNAAYKVAGSLLLSDDVPAHLLTLATDSRVTFEFMRAAAVAGFGAVVTTAEVSSMAVDLARETNTVLVGGVTDGRFSVYSGA